MIKGVGKPGMSAYNEDPSTTFNFVARKFKTDQMKLTLHLQEGLLESCQRWYQFGFLIEFIP